MFNIQKHAADPGVLQRLILGGRFLAHGAMSAMDATGGAAYRRLDAGGRAAASALAPPPPAPLPRGSGADVIPFVQQQADMVRILGLQMMREQQKQQGAPGGGGVIENLLPWIPQAGTRIGPGGRGAGLMGGMLERIMDAMLGNMSPMSPHGPLELWREPEELVPFGGGPGVNAQPRGDLGPGHPVAREFMMASSEMRGAAHEVGAAARALRDGSRQLAAFNSTM